MPEHEYTWEIVEEGDNGEFLTWATLVAYEDGKALWTESFQGTSEEPPGHSARELAASFANAWKETMDFTIEERLGPFGREWQREQEERREGQ